MAVRGDVRAGAIGFFDGGANLFIGILAAIERIGGRRDASRRHDLDVRCAAAKFLANGAADGIGAIGDDAEVVGVEGAAATVRSFERMIAGAEVAMAAGLRDHAAAVEQARHAIEQAVFDRRKRGRHRRRPRRGQW